MTGQVPPLARVGVVCVKTLFENARIGLFAPREPRARVGTTATRDARTARMVARAGHRRFAQVRTTSLAYCLTYFDHLALQFDMHTVPATRFNETNNERRLASHRS